MRAGEQPAGGRSFRSATRRVGRRTRTDGEPLRLRAVEGPIGEGERWISQMGRGAAWGAAAVGSLLPRRDSPATLRSRTDGRQAAGGGCRVRRASAEQDGKRSVAVVFWRAGLGQSSGVLRGRGRGEADPRSERARAAPKGASPEVAARRPWHSWNAASERRLFRPCKPLEMQGQRPSQACARAEHPQITMPTVRIPPSTCAGLTRFCFA